jgi:hypothetical protein
MRKRRTSSTFVEMIMAVTGSVPAQQEELDLITIGRVSVDLYGQQIGSRL